MRVQRLVFSLSVHAFSERMFLVHDQRIVFRYKTRLPGLDERHRQLARQRPWISFVLRCSTRAYKGRLDGVYGDDGVPHLEQSHWPSSTLQRRAREFAQLFFVLTPTLFTCTQKSWRRFALRATVANSGFPSR